MIWWLVLLLAWAAISVVAGVVMGAVVRRAQQVEDPDPYARLLTSERLDPVPF